MDRHEPVRHNDSSGNTLKSLVERVLPGSANIEARSLLPDLRSCINQSVVIRLKPLHTPPCLTTATDFSRFLTYLNAGIAVSDSDLRAYALLPDRVYVMVTPQRKDSLEQLIDIIQNGLDTIANDSDWDSATTSSSVVTVSVIASDLPTLLCQHVIEQAPDRARLAKESQSYEWSGRECKEDFEGLTSSIYYSHLLQALETTMVVGSAQFVATMKSELWPS